MDAIGLRGEGRQLGILGKVLFLYIGLRIG